MRWMTAALLALTACGGGDADGNAQEAVQAQAECPRFHPDGMAPRIESATRAEGLRTLCRRAFAVGHSPKVRQPLWVAEHLTEAAVRLGRETPRTDRFHPEEELPKGERAELGDYSRTGWDRGHMAPDADMPSPTAVHQALSLANISPQAPELNRRSWMELESATRRQTRGGDVYVVTGPLFEGSTLTTTKPKGRLVVPTSFYKAIYAPKRGGTVFIASNGPRPRWTTLSVQQFAAVHGLDPFPGMPEEMRNVNGSMDGSLTALKSGEKGAEGAGGATQGGGRNENGERMARDPDLRQWVTESEFRARQGREPTKTEYKI